MIKTSTFTWSGKILTLSRLWKVGYVYVYCKDLKQQLKKIQRHETKRLSIKKKNGNNLKHGRKWWIEKNQRNGE